MPITSIDNDVRAAARALLGVPRPPGLAHNPEGHGLLPTEWYTSEIQITVCNCREHCLPINAAFHNAFITSTEWREWYGENYAPGYTHLATYEAPRTQHEIEEIEEEDMTKPPNMTKFTCACCNTEYARVHRVVGKLEVPNDHGKDRLCRRCSDHYYYYAPYNLSNPSGANTPRGRRWIRSELAVRLNDISDIVSLAFAQRYCVRTSDNYWWHSTAAAADHERRLARNRVSTLQMHRAGNSYIFGYHEVNNITLFGWPNETPKDSLCFGVELEMEHKRAIQQADRMTGSEAQGYGVKLSQALGGRLDEPKNRFVLARDGSLGYSGIELITNPYTLDYHQHTFGWNDLLRPAVSAGAVAGSLTVRCGMHVHVNRKAISPLTLGKALIFVNSPENRALIERIAQRSSNSYTNLRPKKLADGRAAFTAKYEAMHLSDQTVEFRIFRGNLRADRVLKNIEFCHSVFGYVAAISAQRCQGYNNYLRYIVENAKLYPNLLAFLRESDTIARRRGTPQVQITEEI